MTAPVLRQRRGPLGLLTLNRPAERNPLDPGLAGALLTGLTELFADDTVRCVAITAAGPAFCAGGDLRQMGRLAAQGGPAAYAWPQAIADLHRLMLAAPKPVLAAVDGPAYAGGFGLAGMCDLVLATPRAAFGLPEVKVGLFPMIVVAHLVRSLPRKALLEMMLTGEPMDAAEAYRLGFVTRVYDDADALDAALDVYAERFAAASPDAIRLGRRAFTLLADLPAGQAVDAAQFLNVPFFLGPDLAEGAAAFLDRRPPRWSPDA